MNIIFKKNKHITNFLFYAINNVLSGLISIISVPLFINLLGADTYGRYSLILVIISTVHFGIGGTLNQSMLRYGVSSNNSFRNVNDIFLILIILECLLCVLLFASITIIFKDLYIGLLSGIILFLMGFYQLYLSFAQSQGRAKDTTTLEIIRNIAFIVFPLVLIKLFDEKKGIYFLLSGILLSHFIVSFMAIIKLTKEKIVVLREFIEVFAINKGSSIYRTGIKIWNFSWPFTGWFIFSNLLNLSDRYVIAHYIGYKEVGYYSAIYDLMYKGATLSLAPILTIIYPILIKYYDNNQTKNVNSIIIKVVFTQILLLIVVISIVNLFESDILKFFFNESVSTNNSYQTLVYLVIIGSFLWQIAMVVHKKIELKQETWKMLVAVCVAFCVNLLLNILLIPNYGVIAAGFNTIIGSIIYIIIILYYIKTSDTA